MHVVAGEFISLDGVVQAPGEPGEDTQGGFAHGGWSRPYTDPEVVGGAFDGAVRTAEALLVGRRTWEAMARVWPERAGEPLADRMNSMRKYVVSNTLGPSDLTWENTVLVPGADLVGRVRDLRATEGGDLLVLGSARLVRTLLAEGMVDELILMRMPVLLGGGKSVFPADGVKRPLELVSSVTARTGTQVCVYRAAAED
ncbi:dihydrofolate reductase family protein [Streptomyces griseosporeus]|uniref:dihydrofolate reductase family protein n=1 Tax=Streptomyces griseosporeus TaxID=1910 RepID=UPI0036F771F8